MTLDQLKAALEALKSQALRIDGGIQTLLQLIEQAEAAQAAESKD
jgi:hypothetical protein